MTNRRLSSSCHRHPTSKPSTGFCAQCLRERLAGIPPTSAELRRTKSNSSSSNLAADGLHEPRRKSCDVVRNRDTAAGTLSDLFDQEHHSKRPKSKPQLEPELEDEEEEEEEEVEEEEEKHDVTRVWSGVDNNNNNIDFEDEEGEFKTMKEFIDLECESKMKKTRLGFWETASSFSKRLSKSWQGNNKEKKKQVAANSVDVIDEKNPNVGRTQSEIGEFGLFWRRSCDTDPRLSLDAARYSFDEPRASLDGYLNEKFSYLPRFRPLISVIEDVRSVEVKEGEEEDEKSPGGSEQTRDYYGETVVNPLRRRKSFENRKGGLGDVDDVMSAVLNAAKLSPETVGLFHGAKLLVTEKELRDSNWYSAKDESASSKENADLAAAASVGLGQKGGFRFKRSQKKWSNMWGLIGKRQSESKFGDEEEVGRGGGRFVGENIIDGDPLPESRQNLRRVADKDTGEVISVSQKLVRSYSVSARNSFQMDALILGKSNNTEANIENMKRKDELLLQRNRSARYSPNNLDNGLLRFYLTPSRTYKRSKSVMCRLKNVHSVAGNVL